MGKEDRMRVLEKMGREPAITLRSAPQDEVSYEPEDEKETTTTGTKPTRPRTFPTAPTRAAPANIGTPC